MIRVQEAPFDLGAELEALSAGRTDKIKPSGVCLAEQSSRIV